METEAVIDSYLNAVEARIRAESLIVTFEVERVHTSQITAYMEANAIFMDGSRLVAFEHVRLEGNRVQCTDYRYHYMDATNKLIFRYDNARHHPEVETFPDHKHSPSGV